MHPLPIDSHKETILSGLIQHKKQLLIAAPGTGKSTRIPPYIAQRVGTTLLIEPRRTATKLLAHRIAKEWGCKVGEQVGYQIRFDAQYSRQTKLLIVTEGIALQRMISDPFLEEFSAVILDEIHERSLNGDLLLGFCKEALSLRDDMLLMLMSATIDPQRYLQYFDQEIQTYRVPGRTHSITIHYEDQVSALSFIERLQKMVQTALSHIQPKESILVFLPGRKDILEAVDAIQHSSHPSFPLYSALPFSEQKKIFSESPKLIFSTNVAESSITIPNIGAVIDSGLEKIAIDQGGFGRLHVVDISMESADQRAGRAGRTSSGHCFRMWRSTSRKRAHRRAEIEHSDIVHPLLRILQYGLTPSSFSWLTRPSQQRLDSATEQLIQLGMMKSDMITPLGSEISKLPVHPRIGRVLYEANQRNVLPACAQIAALLVQGIPIQLQTWQEQCNEISHSPLLRKIYRRLIGCFSQRKYSLHQPISWDLDAIQHAWLRGYSDRVALQRSPQKTYLLSDGSQAQLFMKHPPKWILALDLYQNANHTRTIVSAIPLAVSGIPFEERVIHRWKNQRVEAVVQRHIGSICIHEQNMTLDQSIAEQLLYTESYHSFVNHPPHSKASLGLWRRISYVRDRKCSTPFPSVQDILHIACMGKRSQKDLQKIDMLTLITESLTWEHRNILEQHAPSHFQTPSTARIAIDYTEEGPILRARIQQLFGLKTHPYIGPTAIIIELLAPNNRIQQRTLDIAAFWSGSYLDIRKQLRGRYAKHAWPENPKREDAQNHPKRRKT